MKINIKSYLQIAALGLMSTVAFTSCDDTESYSDLLREEEKAVNWYLANQQICLTIPSDSVFQTGEDAPYYKMDVDGYVYMQVVNAGDLTNRPSKGDRVYFRFMRLNIKNWWEDGSADYADDYSNWEGNSEDLDSSLGTTDLFFGNSTLTSTTIYGDGIQVPLNYLGYNSEVNLVIKSPEGFTTDVSSCLPYVYNVRYFKAEY